MRPEPEALEQLRALTARSMRLVKGRWTPDPKLIGRLVAAEQAWTDTFAVTS